MPPASSTPNRMRLTRRRLLLGSGALGGLAVARGLGAGGWLEPDRASSPSALLRELASTLTRYQRDLIVLPADHPSRQIINTVSVLDRPHLGTLLSPHQLGLVDDLTTSLLSPSGRQDFAGTLAVEGRFEGCVLAVYGDPMSDEAHVVLQGGHVMVRGGGGRATANSPFGGGTAYGHQIGNQLWRVQGNSFSYHGDAANQLMDTLDSTQRAAAIQVERPHELVLQPQGDRAAIPGIRIGSLPDPAREAGANLVAAVLSIHPQEVREEALSALDAWGGIDALHFSTFADKGFYSDMQSWSELSPDERGTRGTPYWQVWRLEGPGAVFHFQGHPHVHAYVNIVRDPAAALIGETLAVVDAPVAGADMGALLGRALAHATGEPLGWLGTDPPGRFCTGPVTTGLAFSLDPYANRIVVATVASDKMADPLRSYLTEKGVPLETARDYRVATIGYVANDTSRIGEVTSIEQTGILMRDGLIGFLREGGLERG